MSRSPRHRNRPGRPAFKRRAGGVQTTIGPFTFPTKKAAKEEIQRILHCTPHRQPLTGTDYALIRSLVDCHPRVDEKVGPGIATIEVVRVEGNNGFLLTRTDGSKDDFSYIRALNGALTPQQAVLRAMRSAVMDQILDFKLNYFAEHADDAERVWCPVTEQMIGFDKNAHVDHEAPTFQEIADEFVATFGGYSNIPLGQSTEHTGPALTEDHLEQWRRWHEQHAQLRVIHRSANLLRRQRAAA